MLPAAVEDKFRSRLQAADRSSSRTADVLQRLDEKRAGGVEERSCEPPGPGLAALPIIFKPLGDFFRLGALPLVAAAASRLRRCFVVCSAIRGRVRSQWRVARRRLAARKAPRGLGEVSGPGSDCALNLPAARPTRGPRSGEIKCSRPPLPPLIHIVLCMVASSSLRSTGRRVFLMTLAASSGFVLLIPARIPGPGARAGLGTARPKRFERRPGPRAELSLAVHNAL